MNKIDMHIHIMNDKTPQPEKLLERFDECGVSAGVLLSVQPEQYSGFTMPYKQRLRNLQEWTKNYPDKFYPFLWVHPYEKNAVDIVKDAAKEGVVGFKMICNNYYVSDKKSIELLSAISELDKPVIFHTGILWTDFDSSKYNRPVLWESLLQIQGLKFALAHCSWPWYDECIAVYGKYLNACIEHPEVSSEMFFDLTPGTPPIYRKDLLTKLFTVGYDDTHNIMFGTDGVADDYHPEWTKSWLERDAAIMNELSISEQTRSLIYEENFMRFIGKIPKNFTHKLPQMNQEG